MENCNISIELLQLKKDIDNNKILVKDVVKSTGIDQSQISKILNNKYKSKSENYNKLCKFALNNCEINLNDLTNDLVNRIKKLGEEKDILSLTSIYKVVKYLE